MISGNQGRLLRSGIAPAYVTNCRAYVRGSVTVMSARGPSAGATTVLSETTNATTNAVLAKVAELLAAGTSGGQPTDSHVFAHNDIEKNISFSFECAGKVGASNGTDPAVKSVAAALGLPPEWLFVSSAAEWFEQHRHATAAGVLLATVFVSDKAALAHATLLERLRCNFGTGADAPIRFVYVRVTDHYHQRHCAASSRSNAASARSAACLTLGRVSHIAGLHGLDVALTAFLPGGVRAFPSMLLTGGPSATASEATPTSPWSWSAATRVGELTQLVSDWAFISDLRRSRRRQELRQQQQRGKDEHAQHETGDSMKSHLSRSEEALAAATKSNAKIGSNTGTVSAGASGSLRKVESSPLLVSI